MAEIKQYLHKGSDEEKGVTGEGSLLYKDDLKVVRAKKRKTNSSSKEKLVSFFF